MKPRAVLLILSCIVIAAASLFVGPKLAGPHAEFIFLELRVPRLLVGMLAGSALALAGACFQIIFNNPLATPSTVGTLAGATLGALFALTLGLDSELGGLPLTTFAAFVGALGTSFAVAGIASSGRARMSDVLLAGIAVSLAASAIATGIQYAADTRAMFAASRWSLGQLPQVGYRGVVVLTPFVAVSTIVLLAQGRALGSFALGEEVAHAQGVNVRRLRLVVLIAASLSVAAIVAWCGPIAFVGLIVPHFVRLALGPQIRALLPLSAIVGAAFLTLCDALARSLLPGRELPVGVLTAALGAPALIALIARARR
ncbi:MAG TPA: iron ABC transporter permease [Polyangiaceae bacterium]|nr:iron ABC transporter permease [Polyangiaceae bacterium]